MQGSSLSTVISLLCLLLVLYNINVGAFQAQTNPSSSFSSQSQRVTTNKHLPAAWGVVTSNLKDPPSLSQQHVQHIDFMPRWNLRSSRGMSDNDEEQRSPVRIIIAGAPASGKGTQCEVIKAKYGVVHLSTGDMLRAAVSAGTAIGQKAKEYMDSGRLVPDDVIIGVVQDRLSQADCQRQGWLLDGFPRTKAQAQALADAGVCPDCFLFLHVPDDALVERVVGRRTDPVTGKIYHMTFAPPPTNDPDLLARLEHRSDDTEEKVKVRLEQFHANVEAVKDSYTDISVVVDGNQDPKVVAQHVCSAIEEAMMNKVAATS